MASRTAAPPPVPTRSPLDLEITVISAKHLKNVNWRNGDLKPYAVAYIDPDRRAATKPDDSGGIKPVWNEMLPPLALPDCGVKDGSCDFSQIYLTIDIFHSKPSETPKPLVGTARIALGRLLNDYPNFRPPIKTLELRRPSGRPHGNIRIKLALTERPAPPPPTDHIYQIAPPPPRPPSEYNYYSAAPPPPPVATREYGRYSPASPPPPYTSPYSYISYSDLYTGSGYYSAPAYYSAPPAPAISPPYYSQAPTAGYGGPSAPVEYSSGPPPYYELKARGSKAEFGTGLAVGAVAGALAGMALEEAVVKYEEDKTAERVESVPGARDGYGDYRDDY